MHSHLLNRFDGLGAVEKSVNFPTPDAVDEFITPRMVGDNIANVIDFVGENEVVPMILGQLL